MGRSNNYAQFSNEVDGGGGDGNNSGQSCNGFAFKSQESFTQLIS